MSKSIVEEAYDEQSLKPVIYSIDKNPKKYHKKDRLRGARANKLFS